MATNPFQSIRARAGDTQRSLQWYQSQIKALSSAAISPNKLIQNAPGLTTTLLPGGMYMFLYDPKLKDKLPYFDQFPLVLPFQKVPGGFFGINLHYLPYSLRFKLLGALHENLSNKSTSETSRLKINWRILQSMSRVAPIETSVKRYLDEQVQSRFLQIKYDDWVTASLLPVERFVGATKQDIWRQSRKSF